MKLVNVPRLSLSHRSHLSAGKEGGDHSGDLRLLCDRKHLVGLSERGRQTDAQDPGPAEGWLPYQGETSFWFTKTYMFDFVEVVARDSKTYGTLFFCTTRCLQVKYGGSRSTVVQFLFYQPIRHQWRETDFFPCSVSCGGGELVFDSSSPPPSYVNIWPRPSAPPGYQLNSAECVDIRSSQTLPEHHCASYPENTKPTPKLKECNMDPCPDR